MLKNQPVINKFTVYLYGERDRNGQLCSRIFNGTKSLYSPLSPKNFIDETLVNRGFDLLGAMHSSRILLGNKNMRPIVIDAHLGIYLFPSKSPGKPDCVWFSLMHVSDTEPIGRSKTKVYLNFGHSVILDMKECNFKRRLKMAQELRRIISENRGVPITFYFDSKPTTKIVIKR